MAIRLFWVLLAHVVAIGVVLASAWYLSSDQAAIAPDILDRIIDQPAQIAQRLDDIRSELFQVAVAMVALSFLFATAFVLFAERDGPVSHREQRGRRSLWVVLFGLLIAAVLLWFWLRLVADGAAPWMAEGVGTGQGLVTLVVVVIVYWLATAFGVKWVMRLSVPGADTVRRK